MFRIGIRGLVAQLEERGVCNAEARGSNPLGSTAVVTLRYNGSNAPGDVSHRGRAEGLTANQT